MGIKGLTAGLLLTFGVGFLPVRASSTEIPIVFENTTGMSGSQIWIQFLGGNPVAGTYTDTVLGMQNLEANKSYSLDQLAGGAVNVSSFSGRIYVNYGAYGLQNLGADNGGYTPSANVVSDPNYLTRYQYFEQTLVPQANGSTTIYTDLSYIDFTAISFSLKATNAAGTPLPPSSGIFNTNQITPPTQNLVNLVTGAAISGHSTAPIAPQPASSTTINSTFARVLSPQFANYDSTASYNWATTNSYHDFTPYLTSLVSKSVHLSGYFVGSQAPAVSTTLVAAQTYDFTGTFGANGAITLQSNDLSGYSDVAWAAGSSGTDNGILAQVGAGGYVKIEIAGGALNLPSGIYGNNVDYVVKLYNSSDSLIVTYTYNTGVGNDVFGRVVGDLLAGLSLGYVGSTTTNSSIFGGTAFGQLSSTQWWAEGETGQPTYIPTVKVGTTIQGTEITWDQTPAKQGLYFGAVNAAGNYDPYAAALATVTTAYGFPLEDRLGNNLLVYNTGQVPSDTQVRLVINPDTTTLATSKWIGSASANWNEATNWSGNLVPPSNASDQFVGSAGNGTGSYTIDLTGPQSSAGIYFNYNSGTFIIGADSTQTINLSGNVINSSSHLQTINAALNLGSDGSMIAAAANLSFGGPITLNGYTLAVGGTEDTEIDGVIADGSGAGAVIKADSGTLTLNGANTFTGGLSVLDGTVVLGNSSAAGSTNGTTTGILTLGNAATTVTVQAGAPGLSLANPIDLGGNVVISGSNGLTFAGPMTLLAAQNSTGVAIASNWSISSSVNVEFSGSIGEAETGSGLTLSGPPVSSGFSFTLSGASANTFTGTLAVDAGQVILNKNANVEAYGGSLTVGDGVGAAESAVVQLAADGQTNSTGSITVNADGKLDLQTFTASATGLNLTGGTIAGTTGVLTLEATSQINFTGVDDAAAVISAGVALQGLQTFNIAKTSADEQLTISGDLTTTSGANVTKNGSGVLAFTGTNTLGANTIVTVNGGVLRTGSLAGAIVSVNNGGFGSISSGTVDAPIEVFNLSANGGAFLLGLGTGSTSDQIQVTGTTNLQIGTGPTFLFENAGLNGQSGTFTFTLISGPTVTWNAITLANLQFASIDIEGLVGTFQTTTTNAGATTQLQFVGQAGVSTTWSPTAGSGSWEDGSKWVGGNVPQTGSVIHFAATTPANPVVTLGSPHTTGSIYFDSGAAAYALSGGAITLGGNLVNNSTTAQVIGNALILNASRTVNAASGDLTLGAISLSSTGALAGTLTFDGASNTTTTVNGIISDGPAAAGRLIMDGTGTLSLLGTNTFTGSVTINSGTVVANSSASLGADPSNLGTNLLLFNGGTLHTTADMTFGQFRGVSLFDTATFETDSATTLTISGGISGAGGLTKTGDGTLALTYTATDNSYLGATTVSDGILSMGYLNALGDSTVGTTVADGATLLLAATFTTPQTSTPLIEENLTISGAGFGGNGALQLANGQVDAWGGTITLAAASTIQTGTGSTLTLAGPVSIQGFELTINTLSGANTNISGALTGSSTSGVSATGAGVLNLSGSNSAFQGTLTVESGATVNVQNNAAISGTPSLVVESGGVLKFNNASNLVATFAAINLAGNGIGSGAAATGALNNVGAGTTTLSGPVTLAGDALIRSSSGQFVINGTIDNAGHLLTLDSEAAQMWVAGIISGNGGLTIQSHNASSVLLSAANTYTGATTVGAPGAAAQLVISNAAALGNSTAGTTVTQGSTLSLQGGITVASEALSISGTGLNGTGALRNVSGDNTYNGAVAITNTTNLQSDSGTLTLGGTISTSSAQTVVIQGSGTIFFAGDTSGYSGTTSIANGATFAANDLSGVNLGFNPVTVANPEAPTFSPGNLGAIANVGLNVFSPNTGTVLLMDLGASGISDQISPTTAFGIPSGGMMFSFNSISGFTGGTYTYDLITVTGGAIGGSLADIEYSFLGATQYAGGVFGLSPDNKTLTFTLEVVPEPSSGLLLIGGAVFLVLLRRRKLAAARS